MAVEKLINELANHGQFNPASSQHLAYEECGEHCWDEDYDSDYELDEPKNDEPKKEVKPVTLDNLSENINLRLSTLWVQRMKLAVGFGLRDSGSLQGARVRPSSKVTRSVQCPESLRLLLCAHPYSETPAAMCGRCFRNNCWLTLRTHRVTQNPMCRHMAALLRGSGVRALELPVGEHAAGFRSEPTRYNHTTDTTHRCCG